MAIFDVILSACRTHNAIVLAKSNLIIAIHLGYRLFEAAFMIDGQAMLCFTVQICPPVAWLAAVIAIRH